MPEAVVAEISRELRSFVARLLREQLGFNRVHMAANAKEALFAVKENAGVNFVFSEYDLPDVPGEEMIQRIREQVPERKIAFVLMSSRSDQDTLEKLKEAGISAYILKPFSQNSIIERVRPLLKKK